MNMGGKRVLVEPHMIKDAACRKSNAGFSHRDIEFNRGLAEPSGQADEKESPRRRNALYGFQNLLLSPGLGRYLHPVRAELVEIPGDLI
jgi:hypothetical protein